MGTTEATIQVGDIAVAYRSDGEGKPLLALHGGPGLGYAYMRPLDRWAEEFQLIYYDQRGSGRTPVGDEARLSVSGGLEDLDGLREAFGLQRANLVGHSFGALIALMYAARYPDRTASLVLLNPAPPLTMELAEQLGANMGARRTPEDDAAQKAIAASAPFRRRDPEAVERFVLNVYLPFFKDRRTAGTLGLGFTAITAANVLGLEDRFVEELQALDPLTVLSRIRCPTLIVHAELDPTPIGASQLLAERIPVAELTVLQGAGHFAHVEEADLLARSVLPFIRKVAQ